MALVFGRKSGEGLVIDLRGVDVDALPEAGKLIVVTFRRNKRGETKLSTVADRSIPVFRDEIFQARETA